MSALLWALQTIDGISIRAHSAVMICCIYHSKQISIVATSAWPPSPRLINFRIVFDLFGFAVLLVCFFFSVHEWSLEHRELSKMVKSLSRVSINEPVATTCPSLFVQFSTNCVCLLFSLLYHIISCVGGGAMSSRHRASGTGYRVIESHSMRTIIFSPSQIWMQTRCVAQQFSVQCDRHLRLEWKCVTA